MGAVHRAGAPHHLAPHPGSCVPQPHSHSQRLDSSYRRLSPASKGVTLGVILDPELPPIPRSFPETTACSLSLLPPQAEWLCLSGFCFLRSTALTFTHTEPLSRDSAPWGRELTGWVMTSKSEPLPLEDKGKKEGRSQPLPPPGAHLGDLYDPSRQVLALWPVFTQSEREVVLLAGQRDRPPK